MMGFQKIYTLTDCLEMQRILDAMAEEHISAYVQERGAGQYFQIRSGMAFVEKDLYVEEGDAEKAGLLIGQLTGESCEAADVCRVPWYQDPRIFARISAIFLVVIIFVLIICSIVFP